MKRTTVNKSMNWEKYKDWKYPYNTRSTLKDPKYIKDRDETFAKRGNGWWWGDGWWNGRTETVADRQRKSRERRKSNNDNG